MQKYERSKEDRAAIELLADSLKKEPILERKKWLSRPRVDETGAPLLQKSGKPVLRKSYSVLQDDFFDAMRKAGYEDVERGERGSSEEHLTVTQFKVEQERLRLDELEITKSEIQSEVVQLQTEKAEAQKEAVEAKSKLIEIAQKLKNMEKLAAEFSADPEELLPEVGALESAKTYREKKAKPLIEKVVKVLRSVYHSYLDIKQKLERLQKKYDYEVPTLRNQLSSVQDENIALRIVAENYNRVCHAYGPERVEATVEAVRQREESQRQRVHATHERVVR